MRIGIIHSYYGPSRPSGENVMVDRMIRQLTDEFGSVSTWVGSADKKLLSKSAFIFLFRHLIFDFKKNAFEIWLYKNDVVQVHNDFPLLTRANLKSIRKYGESHRIDRVIHNYRMTCLRGNHFRKGAGCNLCSLDTFLPGIIRSCYHGNSILSAIVAKNSRILREIISNSDLSSFIGVSPHVSKYILDLVQDESKVETVINQIEDPLQQISPFADEVLYLGRLDPEKDALKFVEKWVSLLERGVELPRLNIVGAGEQEIMIESLIKSFSSKIFLHGYLKDAALEDVIRNCKIFVFTSAWLEPFGLTMIEAASRGMYLIGVDNPILRTLIDTSKNGVILSKNYSNLEECIYLGSIADYSTHLNESQQRFTKIYSSENNGNWAQFYHALKP
jgi:glycosyltransferase involved in cell wall biosynthesis